MCAPCTNRIGACHGLVTEPANKVCAESVEALPTVLCGQARRHRLADLRGSGGGRAGFARLGGGFPGLADRLAGSPALGLGGLRLRLGRLRLGGLVRSGRAGLGGYRRSALVLPGLGDSVAEGGAAGGGGGGAGGGGGGRGGRLRPGCQEGHVSLVGVLFAHLGAVDALSLAGVVQLTQLPHQLCEVVTRVVAVGPAEVGLALEVTVVGACGGLSRGGSTAAGHPQTGVIPRPGDGHGAGVFGLGVETDRLVPDAALGRLLHGRAIHVVAFALRGRHAGVGRQRRQHQQQHRGSSLHGA